MIKALILYYLNIKPTHGYEIQRFIQLNEMDQWTKIQSGSIYYALGKLEKEGLICLKEEVGTGPKARKIYGITDAGKEAMKVMAKEELAKELYPTGSDKFIVYPFLDSLDKATIIEVTTSHIQQLNQTLAYMKKWQGLKGHPNSLAIENLSFDMMIASLEFQIRWHEALISQIDENKAVSLEMSKRIAQFDFSQVDVEQHSVTTSDIDQLKAEILSNPQKASEKLEELIHRLSDGK